MNASRLALVRFYIGQHLRSRQWHAGLVLFLVVFPWGVLLSEDVHATFLVASLVAAAVALNFGLAYDRRTGYELFAGNYVSARAMLLWKACASALLFAGLLAVMFGTALLAWREPTITVWYVCRSLLIIWLAVPLALLFETFVTTEFPLVFTGAFIFVIMVTFALQERAAAVIDFLGLATERGVFSSLRRLLVVNLTWNVMVVLGAYAGWLSRHRQARVARF